jgi:Ca2+-binding EF-hand superfamily protein
MDRDGDGGDEQLLEGVVARAHQYGLRANRASVAALLRAVGATVGSGLSRGRGTQLPGLGSLSVRREAAADGAEQLPYFLLQDRFAASHGVAQPSEFVPPKGQRKAPAEPLNFSAVCSRLDPQSGASFGRSDAQTLWDCVVSCFGERALRRQSVVLDLPPVGALRCTPPPPAAQPSGAPRKQRLAFIFSPAFCSHTGVAVPRPSSARTEQQAAYDRDHRASRETVMAATADLAGSRPSSRARTTRAPPARRRHAWGEDERGGGAPPPAPRGGGQQRVGFAGRGETSSREPDAVSGGAAWGDDRADRGATPASESSFGHPGRNSSRASTRTSDDDYSQFAQLEEGEQRGLQIVCRLLDVFRACDINDTGKLASGDVGPRLADVLGLDLQASDGSTVARWLQAAGTGRSGADWLGRLGFVRGFLAAAAPRQGQLETPAIVRRVAERALDPTNLLDDGAKASLVTRSADTGVPAAQVQAVLQEVLPGWPERALLWLVAGRDPQRVLEIERARQYSQPEPLIDYNEVLLGAGAGSEGFGEGGAAGHHGMQAVSAAEGDLLRILHDTMQKDRLTVADAFHTMDTDHDGRITVADMVTFLRNRGESVAPQVISELLGGEASVDYPYLRRRLDRVSGAMALADDWEEGIFQAIRDWAGSQRMTLKEAFQKFAGGAAKMDREQFHGAVRQAAGDDLTVWELDHLFRFVDASGTGKIDVPSWLRRFEPNARPAGWAERCFQQLADILYAKQMTLPAFVTSLDDNKDGKLSISELQRGILKLQSGLDREEQLSTAEAKELAQLTDPNHSGLVDVATLEARVNKGTASADTDANLLKIVQKALSKSGQSREAIELVFKRFSGGKSTSLSYEQFSKGVNSLMPAPLSKQQQDRLLKLTDRDGDRSIDVEEFLAILTPNTVDEKKQLRRYLALHLQEEGIGWKELFDSFDADASGFLSLAELQKGFLSLSFFKQRLKLVDKQIKDRAAECFKEADPDQDGYLSTTEFERYFSGKSSQRPMSVGDRRQAERKEQLSGAAGGRAANSRGSSRSNRLAQKGEAFATRRLKPGAAAAPFATEQNEIWAGDLAQTPAAKPKAPWAASVKTKPRGRMRYGTASIQPSADAAPVLDASQWSSWPDVNSREFKWPKPVQTRGPKLNPLKSLEPDQRFRDRLFERNVTPMEVFRAFDVDGDGFVSREEWLFGMSGRSKATEAVLGDIRELKLTLPDAERIFNMMEGSEKDWVDQAAFWAVCQERQPAPGWEVGVVKQIKSWLQTNKIDADKLWKMWIANSPEVKELKPKQFAAGLRQIGITLSAPLVAGLIRWLTKGTEQVLTRKVFAAKVAVGGTTGWQTTAIGKIGALLTKGFPNNQMAWQEFRKRDDAKRSSAPHLDSWQRFRDLCEQDPAGKQLKLTANQWKELFHSMHPQSGRATLDLGEFNIAFDRSSWAKQTLTVAADAFSTQPGRSPAEIFRQVDSNGDGTIDRAEFERAMRLLNPSVAAEDVERLWAHVDTAGQGKVGLAQFCSRLGESSVGMSKEVDNANAVRNLIKASGDVDKVFKSIDKSGDGFIDPLEFKQALTRLGAGLSARECQAVFSHLDKNGDGGLSLDELREWITGKQSQGDTGSWASQTSGSGRSAGEVFHQVVAGGPGADREAFCVIARILCPAISPSDLQQAWALINPNGESSFLPLTQLSTRLAETTIGQHFDEEIAVRKRRFRAILY